MTAFSVFAPSRARQVGLLGIDGNDLQIGADDEEVELPASRFALSSFKHDASFQHTRCRYQATFSRRDRSEKLLTVGFGEEDGRKGRRVDDHNLWINVCRSTFVDQRGS